MKKTMFITSVIMVVVMAIALTTSSLAWFSAAGRATVTTTPLTVQAASSTSTGLLISLDNENFAENVTLAAAPNGGLKPIVPIDNALAAETAPAQANLLTALYKDSFIGNKVASGLVVDPAIEYGQEGYNVATQRTIFAYASGLSGDAVPATFDGYYTDEVWIANMASGGEAGVKIIPSVSFQRKIGDAEYTAYDGSNHTSTSPIMYVAILADVTDGDLEYVSEGTAANPTAWTDNIDNAINVVDTDSDGNPDAPYARLKDTWELVQVFSTASMHQNTAEQYDQIASSLSMGNYAANFASGRVVNHATNLVSLDLAGKTATALAPAQAGANLGVAKHFKIVVWYDGATLNNNNSGWNFRFNLTFTAE